MLIPASNISLKDLQCPLSIQSRRVARTAKYSDAMTRRTHKNLRLGAEQIEFAVANPLKKRELIGH
jgi:hypothetical protein